MAKNNGKIADNDFVIWYLLSCLPPCAVFCGTDAAVTNALAVAREGNVLASRRGVNARTGI